MKKINFGIIGLGAISNTHIKAVKKTKGAGLVAVCSRSPEKVRLRAEELEVRGYTSFEELLRDSEVDAIIILTPPYTHAEIGIRSARAGKHVMIEKPIDIDEEKAKELIDTCEEKGVKLTVISQMRFGKAITKVKRKIEKGDFGKIVLIRASMKWNRSRKYYESKLGETEEGKKGRGVLINQAIHFLDLIRWLGGEYEGAYLFKKTVKPDLPIEDTVVGVVKFKNDAVGVLEATTATCRNLFNVLEVHGTNGSVVIKNNKIIESHFGPYSIVNTIKSRLKSKFISLIPMRKGHHADQVKEFVEAIRKNKPILVDGWEGYRTLELCNRMYQNAE